MNQPLLDRLRDHVVVFDGAMGTQLQAAGLPPGAAPESWNLARPDQIVAIHRAYLEAGAEAVETNSFGANEVKLAEYGLAHEAEEINVAAARLARRAVEEAYRSGRGAPAGLPGLVAGSIGPTGKFVEPLGDLEFERAIAIFGRQAAALERGGADVMIIETMADLGELKAAVIGVQTQTRLPVIAQMTFNADGRTFTGTDPATAMAVLQGLGVQVIGANCSGGPAELLPVLERMAALGGTPLSLQPNAGLPRLTRDGTVYPLDPAEFAAFGPGMVKAGASLVGGCCGTTPAHIRALAAAARELKPPQPAGGPLFALAGRTLAVFFREENLPVLVGERINPTARRKLADDIRGDRFELVRSEASAQARAGAHVLDLNVGVPGIDEAAAMARAVAAVQATVDLPLSLDSPNPPALEAGLRRFIGKPLLNSVTGEKARLEAVLPLAKRYGAGVIALTLDDQGIPLTAEARLAVAEKILDRALALGIPRHNIIVDCLVLTVAAQPREAMETPRTVRLVKEKLGLPTILGVSNVSYGLPRRELLNSAYLAANLAHGLDAAIVNPRDQRVWEAVRAMRLLQHRDRNAAEYISFATSLAGVDETPPKGAPPAAGHEIPEALRQALREGNRESILTLLEHALRSGWGAMQILNEVLIPTLEALGDDFGAGKVFLPQLMLAAEAMKAAFGRLRPELGQAASRRRGTVVLATVEGDIHDIGKNIVGVLLENYGFRVVDLGKGVPASRIVEAARAEGADIVGLSALMTTTMPQMRRVLEAARQAALPSRIIIGGAVTTPQYAREIGAHGHGKDARAAVELCRELTSQRGG